MTQLSAHFSLEELTVSQEAERKGLDNTPDALALAHLSELAVALEDVRSLLGHPIIISSGYRSPKVNASVGGVSTSAHCQGWAADFICPGFGTPKAIAEEIRDSQIDFDQCIWEFRRWVHFSVSSQSRRQVMTASLLNGKVNYQMGVV